jgi:hypothetical protein
VQYECRNRRDNPPPLRLTANLLILIPLNRPSTPHQQLGEPSPITPEMGFPPQPHREIAQSPQQVNRLGTSGFRAVPTRRNWTDLGSYPGGVVESHSYLTAGSLGKRNPSERPQLLLIALRKPSAVTSSGANKGAERPTPPRRVRGLITNLGDMAQ